MGYCDKLTELLSPLGVYSFADGSFSYGEVKAIGAELDLVQQELANILQNSVLPTASLTALNRWEGLFRTPTAADTAAGKLAALKALMNIGWGCFTPEAIGSAVAGSGIQARVTELTGGQIQISFPGVMGIPPGIDRIKAIIGDILPAQLEPVYYYRYAFWREAASMTWQSISSYSWGEVLIMEPETW